MSKNIFNDLKDDTKKFTKKEIEEGKGLSVFAYLIPFIPYFFEKKNKYVKYHTIQGMNLFIISAIYSAFYYIFSLLFSYIYMIANCRYMGKFFCHYSLGYLPLYLLVPLRLIGLCLIGLMVWGVINVFQDKAKELPIINKVKIFK